MDTALINMPPKKQRKPTIPSFFTLLTGEKREQCIKNFLSVIAESDDIIEVEEEHEISSPLPLKKVRKNLEKERSIEPEMNYNFLNDCDTFFCDDFESSQVSKYKGNVESRNYNWEDFRPIFFKKYLKTNTICGRHCQAVGCDERAEAFCSQCTNFPKFCGNHAKIHNLTNFHVLVDGKGRYVNSYQDNEVSESVKIPLYINLFGWFRFYGDNLDIPNEEEWFPLTPSRSSSFVHISMMRWASSMLQSGMLSATAILKIAKATFLISPPPKWETNFGEALRYFSVWSMQMNCGMTESDIDSGAENCRFNCPACFPSTTAPVPSEKSIVEETDTDTDTVIMVYFCICFTFSHVHFR